MSYQHAYLFEVVRPLNVYNAAKYLVGTPVYIEENIKLSEMWAASNESDVIRFTNDPNEKQEIDKQEKEKEAILEMFPELSEADLMPIEDEKESGGYEDSDNDWIDEGEDEEVNPGGQETMFHREDDCMGIKYCPTENQKPISLLQDINAEVLSFPQIFAGQKRKLNEANKYSYLEIAKWDIRCFDRRCCTPEILLYKYKVSQIHRIKNTLGICMRRKNKAPFTAGQMANEGNLSKAINDDEGYALLKGIRSSPAYWESQLKKLLGMVRQLGIPTFFITVSAAETKWNELLVIQARSCREIIKSPSPSFSHNSSHLTPV